MRFEEALPYVREGKKIRRIDRDYTYELEKDDLECSWNLTLGDLNGEWEVVEQALTLDERSVLISQTRALKWFGKEIISISKHKTLLDENKAYIEFQLKDKKTDLFETFSTPTFNAKELFVGIKFNKDYTLKELGINV